MSRPDRYAQCDDTCTVDCGACKGAGHPAAPAAEADLRAEMIAALPGAYPWGDVVDALLAGPLQRLVEADRRIRGQ